MSISSINDGDVLIRSKHDEEKLYFVVQWTDEWMADDHFEISFEDDGKEPNHKFDSMNEDYKYGGLEPDGDEINYRDGCWDDGWSIDGGYDKPELNVCDLGSYWSNGKWVLEVGIPLNNDDTKDVNVTGDEVLGYLFKKSSFKTSDLSPATAEYNEPTTWAELHIQFSDGDNDKDGSFDCCDDFPSDPNEWNDLDNDGVGDNSDTDDDNDGHDDDKDAFPSDPTEWKDSDGDGYGDNVDQFPEDEKEWIDSDGDGVGDNTDEFLFNENEWKDSDGDKIGDNTDAFPKDPDEWRDFDEDGKGDNSDTDDDNDGYSDEVELSEGLDQFDNSSIPPDLDKDLIPDSTDDDIDGDGVNNRNDEFTRDSTR